MAFRGREGKEEGGVTVLAALALVFGASKCPPHRDGVEVAECLDHFQVRRELRLSPGHRPYRRRFNPVKRQLIDRRSNTSIKVGTLRSSHMGGASKDSSRPVKSLPRRTTEQPRTPRPRYRAPLTPALHCVASISPSTPSTPSTLPDTLCDIKRR